MLLEKFRFFFQVIDAALQGSIPYCLQWCNVWRHAHHCSCKHYVCTYIFCTHNTVKSYTRLFNRRSLTVWTGVSKFVLPACARPVRDCATNDGTGFRLPGVLWAHRIGRSSCRDFRFSFRGSRAHSNVFLRRVAAAWSSFENAHYLAKRPAETRHFGRERAYAVPVPVFPPGTVTRTFAQVWVLQILVLRRHNNINCHRVFDDCPWFRMYVNRRWKCVSKKLCAAGYIGSAYISRSFFRWLS